MRQLHPAKPESLTLGKVTVQVLLQEILFFAGIVDLKGIAIYTTTGGEDLFKLNIRDLQPTGQSTKLLPIESSKYIPLPRTLAATQNNGWLVLGGGSG